MAALSNIELSTGGVMCGTSGPPQPRLFLYQRTSALKEKLSTSCTINQQAIGSSDATVEPFSLNINALPFLYLANQIPTQPSTSQPLPGEFSIEQGRTGASNSASVDCDNTRNETDGLDVSWLIPSNHQLDQQSATLLNKRGCPQKSG